MILKDSKGWAFNRKLTIIGGARLDQRKPPTNGHKACKVCYYSAMDKNTLIIKLREYFQERTDVAFAYLFGSMVSGITHASSDIDIGVYFKTKTGELEYESETEYSGEKDLWSDLERVTGRETDMVVLNRAPSILFDGVLKNGLKIFSNDDALLLRLWLAVGMAAQDFREFTDDFVTIRNRSRSLSQQDRDRLTRMVVFLENEMQDHAAFKDITQQDYQSNRDIKRNLERWVENAVNVGIDIAKVLLASEKKMIPETYKNILADLASLPGFDAAIAKRLGESAIMRNILAHEYLDIRFKMISSFLRDTDKTYAYLIKFAQGKLASKAQI